MLNHQSSWRQKHEVCVNLLPGQLPKVNTLAENLSSADCPLILSYLELKFQALFLCNPHFTLLYVSDFLHHCYNSNCKGLTHDSLKSYEMK